ncbi:MAG TPA: Pycsar system effector family protein [Gammaproteobacteria bacterium]|nr:Pycsar system effector family protein [Gammaproteobacteria bacterium]
MNEQTQVLLEPVPPQAGADGGACEKKDKKKKKKNRGVETMFRVTYQNHVALSRLADNKANMLISINGLIISVMIALVTRGAAVSWTLTPVLVLVAGCLVSLAFAVLGARPRLSRAPVTIDDIRANSGNLLFFGQFTTMPLAEFQASLRVLMKDPELLYDHLGRQLYLMGLSLNTKYRLLQLAYSTFLASIVIATAGFLYLYWTGQFQYVAQ